MLIVVKQWKPSSAQIRIYSEKINLSYMYQKKNMTLTGFLKIST